MSSPIFTGFGELPVPMRVGKAPAFFLMSDHVVKDGANLTSQWTDLSGRGNHFVQATPASQPLWVPNAFNGKPVLRFNNTSQYLQIAKKFANTQSSKMTTYCIIKTNLGNREVVLTDRTSPAGGDDGWDIHVDGAVNKFNNVIVAPASPIATANFTKDKFVLCVTTRDGLLIQAFADDITDGQVAATAYTPDTSTPYTYIGYQVSSTPPDKYFGGDMALMLCYEDYHGAGQISDVTGWIKNFYGLA